MLDDGPRQLTLRIANGTIAGIGGSPQRGDSVLNLVGHAIFPGLINAHDQLELNVFRRIKLRQVYDNAHQWRQDFEAQLDAPGIQPLYAVPMGDRLFFGGLKNLLAGTTMVMHHGPAHRPLRSGRFPVRVVQRYGWVQSLSAEDEDAFLRSYNRAPIDAPWIIPLAEGTDEIAAAELTRLDALGCLDENTILVHGVGLSAADLVRMQETGTGLIWCPESNLFLLGKTHFHPELLGRMALGTGPRLTGSRDLLDEIKCAAAISRLPPHRLLNLVTRDAAALLILDDAGHIASGHPADLVVVACVEGDPYQALAGAYRADLRLVMARGLPRIADIDLEEVFRLTRTSTRHVWLDETPKLIAGELADRLLRTGLEEPGLVLG